MKRALLLAPLLPFLWACQPSTTDRAERTRYEISATLDTSDLSLQCTMDVIWTNTSDTTLGAIPFTFQLDSAHSLIRAVETNGTTADHRYCTKETDGFEGFFVELPDPVPPRETAEFRIRFRTNPASYFRERMLFYSNEFPTIQCLGSKQFLPHHQVHSDYRVTITHPDEFSLAATGAVTHTESAGPTGHAVEVQTEIEAVPSYGFVLMKDVELEEATSAGVLIRSFYFEDDAKWGRKLLEHSENILAFYTDTLGFYPQPVLTIIPGYSKPYGGWPVCPNVVGIHRGIDQKKEKAETHAHWIMAHEIGHQYWGFNCVLEPLDHPQWFGIGMGIYTDMLYTRQFIPEFNHSREFSGSYLQAMKKGFNTTILQSIDSLDKQGFDWNNSVEHDKSFSVLQMLAWEIGEETFFRLLKQCLDRYKGVNVTLDMFKTDCESLCGQNLDDFFHTWFYTNDHLEYRVEPPVASRSGDGYENEITLTRLGNAVISRIEVEILQEDGESRRILFDGTRAKETTTMATRSPIVNITIDPDEKLLLVNRMDPQ
ncbi:MAG: M1 family aminopeptidase [Bacteroidales bacterium]